MKTNQGTTEDAFELLIHDVLRGQKYMTDSVRMLIATIHVALHDEQTKMNQQWIIEMMNAARTGLQSARLRISSHENDNAGCRKCNDDRVVCEYIIRVCESALNKGVERKIEDLLMSCQIES